MAVVKQSRLAYKNMFENNPVLHYAESADMYTRSDKPDWVLPRFNRLLDQVHERVRYQHYILQTEKAYVYWVEAFVLAGGTRAFFSRRPWTE